MGEAADEPPFLQRRDQAVDAGFGAEIKRLFHLVKGRGDAIGIHPCLDEIQKFKLFAGQHRPLHHRTCWFNVLPVFPFCVNRAGKQG